MPQALRLESIALCGDADPTSRSHLEVCPDCGDDPDYPGEPRVPGSPRLGARTGGAGDALGPRRCAGVRTPRGTVPGWPGHRVPRHAERDAPPGGGPGPAGGRPRHGAPAGAVRARGRTGRRPASSEHRERIRLWADRPRRAVRRDGVRRGPPDRRALRASRWRRVSRVGRLDERGCAPVRADRGGCGPRAPAGRCAPRSQALEHPRRRRRRAETARFRPGKERARRRPAARLADA